MYVSGDKLFYPDICDITPNVSLVDDTHFSLYLLYVFEWRFSLYLFSVGCVLGVFLFVVAAAAASFMQWPISTFRIRIRIRI